jgi:hypothetical protein
MKSQKCQFHQKGTKQVNEILAGWRDEMNRIPRCDVLRLGLLA